MITIIDEKTNMRLMEMPGNVNVISIQCEGKAVVETINKDNDVLFKLTVQPNCSTPELVTIIDSFSKYYCSKNPEINGILIKKDRKYSLDSIGFKPINKESEFLYKSNSVKLKKERGTK